MIREIINGIRRDYFIKEVNIPLVVKIMELADKYPEPTHDNVVYPNSHRLLEIQDSFFEHWDFESRNPLVKALFRVVINKYEHSAPYRNALDWFVMVVQQDWKPFNYNRQMRCWKGVKP